MEILATLGKMALWVYGGIFLISIIGVYALKLVTKGRYPGKRAHANDIKLIQFVGATIIFLIWLGVFFYNRATI